MNWELGNEMYTLLWIKWVTNENLLYSTGNSIQCSVVTKREYMYVCICIADLLCCPVETNPML